MNESKQSRRAYSSPRRAAAAVATRANIIACAKRLILKKGIDAITMAEIAAEAGVAESTVYAVLRSKEGILRALMEEAIFGARFEEARKAKVDGADPVMAIKASAGIARAIYEAERADLGLIRQISGYSQMLRDLEQEFDRLRLEMQEQRVVTLFKSGKARAELTLEESRRILWMYTSRDVYRMLVIEGGWTAQRYEDWLASTLLEALVNPSTSSAA